MIDNYSFCEKCPLRDCSSVRGSGESGGLAIIGEAPGVSEVALKKPFVGRSGKFLQTVLQTLMISDLPIYITNACLCRPLGNKKPPKAAIVACRDRLIAELESVNPQKILLLGKSSQTALYPEGRSLTSTRGIGTFSTIGEREVYSVITYHPSAVLRNSELARDFFSDVSKVLSTSTPYDLPKSYSIVIEDPQEALQEIALLRDLEDTDKISCDLETTGFDPLRDSILSIGFGLLIKEPLKSIVLTRKAIHDPTVKQALLDLFLSFQGRIGFHNMKFDLQFLEIFFGKPIRPHKVYDTLLMQYCRDERGESESSSSARYSYNTRGLKDQARIRYDIPDYHFDFKAFFAQPEEERDYASLHAYHGKDCIYTSMLYRDLVEEFEDEPELWNVIDHLLIPGTFALSDVELHGIMINVEYLTSLEREVSSRFGQLQSRLQKIASSHEFEDFNPRSYPQKISLLQKCGVHTKSTAKAVIQELLQNSAIPNEGREVLNLLKEIQQTSGVLNTYIRGILSRVGPDGRIHPDYLLHEAATGRLACRNPNLQNIPVLMGNQIRNAFVAPPGYSLCDLDYSQLELRVAAYYSQDKELIRIFQEGLDIHRQVAAKMFRKDESEVTQFERYLAKYVDFGIIYGRGAYSLAHGWEMDHLLEEGQKPWTLEEAEFFIKEFLESFSGLSRWIEAQKKFVLKHGYVTTPLGRKRRFPLLSRDTIHHVQRKAVNTPIQSLASDICLLSLIRVADILPEDVHIINTVHDSIMFEIPTSRISTIVPQIREEMTKAPSLLPDFTIPLVVNLEIGTTWGEMEKFSDGSNL